MPRLTRTQKYADLRASLTNDNETSNVSPSLEDYQQKLDNLQEKANFSNRSESDFLKNKLDEILKIANSDIDLTSDEDLINKAQEVAEMPKEIISPSPDTKDIFITINEEENKKAEEAKDYHFENVDNTTPVSEAKDYHFENVENTTPESIEQNQKELDENVETIDQFFGVDDIKPAFEDVHVDIAKIEDLNTSMSNEVTEIIDDLNKEVELKNADIALETTKINEESQNIKVDTPLVFEDPNVNINNVTPILNPAIDSKAEDGVELSPKEEPKKEDTNELKFEVIEEAKEEEKAIELRTDFLDDSLKEYENDKHDIGENYISETFEEVNAYNRNEGEKLIDDIPVSIIDEVRHNVVTDDNAYKQNINVDETPEYIDTIEYPTEKEESLEEIIDNYKVESEPEEIEVKNAINNIFDEINNDEVKEEKDDIADFVDEIINQSDEAPVEIKHDNVEETIVVEQKFDDVVTNNDISETIVAEPKTKLDEITERIKKEDKELSNIGKEVYNFENIVENKETIQNEGIINTSDEDEEFSSTVSLQISKIMDELNVIDEKENIPDELIEVKKVEPVAIDASDYDKKNVPDFISAFFNDGGEDEDGSFFEEHPVKAIAQEEIMNSGEVVEIRNISELEDTPHGITIEETKPFIVDDEVEFVEDSTPNKVLNIILIILIVILLAVLGVILYYILIAKGII